MRVPRPRWLAAVVLSLYGLFLIWTNPWVTVFEDEATIVAVARRPVGGLLRSFAAGFGEHYHPPLSDLFLHYWLRLTSGSLFWLRVPFIACYCAALWMVAEIAERLWGRRWTAVLAGAAWPAGYFLGRPAGWYAPTALGVAALTWLYILWRGTGRRRALAAFAAAAALLVYTNYLGWVFVAVLGADLLAARPGRRAVVEFLGAVGVVILAFLPLLSPLLFRLSARLETPRPVADNLLYGVYMAHTLLAGEMAAPWTWPGMLAAAAGAGLLIAGCRARACRRYLLWMPIPLAVLAGLGVLSSARMAMFAPWLLLFLTALLAHCSSKIIRALVAVVFVMGWLGIVTQKYAGSYRYIEPWGQVAAQVMEMSRPGDLIVSSHPSFYFYLSYRLAQQPLEGVPSQPFAAAGRRFSRVAGWRDEMGAAGRLTYVRANLMPWEAAAERELLEAVPRKFRLAGQWRFLEDRGVGVKRLFFPNVAQPRWRIEVQMWERADAP